MDPNNTQPVPVVNQQMPQAPVQSEQVGSPVPKSSKKFLGYGILLGLIVVVLVGAAGFYMLYGSKKTANNVTAVPTPAQTAAVTTAPEVIVNNTSDLDELLAGLDQADKSLNSEMTSLDKDSNF